MTRKHVIVVTICSVVGCGGVAAAALSAAPSGTDPTRLPLGDGKLSTSAKRGYVYACNQGPGRAGGAEHAGSWIQGSTFDLTAKPTVDGHVTWPGRITFRTSGNTLVVSGNGLPKGATTGNFPISSSDDAFTYDRNPNSIISQNVSVTLPAKPAVARTPSCLPMGPIGVAVNGVLIFNALDAAKRDAVAHEIQDSCGGHPQQNGVYHYHSIPTCLTGTTVKSQEQLVGYAFDGFPIFGPRDETGKLLTNADLDACHGHVGWVTLHGKRVRIYHYNATLEYPYTLGCFTGTPRTSSVSAPRG
jgi:hypothetical protein